MFTSTSCLPSSTLSSLLVALKHKTATFTDVIDFINTHYDYTPATFYNGAAVNAANQNAGSARVLFFASIHNLSIGDTLSLFAEHYQSVLQTPSASDHQNIRQFMYYGWAGVSFSNTVLQRKHSY